jgi:hypothetical protein
VQRVGEVQFGSRGLYLTFLDLATTIMARKRRRGELEDLSNQDLPTALESAITSQGSAELALLFLIDNYDFNLDALKRRLQGSCCLRLAIFTKHSRIIYCEQRRDYRSAFPKSSTLISLPSSVWILLGVAWMHLLLKSSLLGFRLHYSSR